MTDWRDEIHALADGELGETEAQAVRTRIAEDPKAAAEYRWALDAREIVRAKCVPIRDDELWQECRRRMDAIDKTRHSEQFVGRYAWALCGVVLLVLVSGGVANRMFGTGQVTEAQAAGLFSMPARTVEVPSESAAQAAVIEREVGEAPIDMACETVRATDLAFGTMPLGQRFVRLNLEDGTGELLLFVIENVQRFEGLEAGEDGFLHGEINRTPCVAWTDGDFGLLLFANRPADDLQAAAAELRRTE